MGGGSDFASAPEISGLDSLGSPAASSGLISVHLNADALEDTIAFREDPPAGTLSLTRPEASFSVTTLTDSGPGALRQAILDANASPGADAVASPSLRAFRVYHPF